jgi:two-component system, LuxR family, response regulator FixJ
MIAMDTEPTVYVVDDDPQACDSVCALARSMGVEAKNFDSAESFLGFYQGQPGCLVSDYRMKGINGLELQKSLLERGSELPLIIVTAYARTSLTVQAIKNGAITLLDKPYDDDNLWQAIRSALTEDERRRRQYKEVEEVRRRIESLSHKEREVLQLMLTGTSNKAMAGKLDVSLRTIENRRRKVFFKLRVDNVAELVALVLQSRDAPAGAAAAQTVELGSSRQPAWGSPEHEVDCR